MLTHRFRSTNSGQKFSNQVTMDVDEVLERIGEFGPAQRKIFFVIGLTQLYMTISTFAMSFVGIDPGWECVVGNQGNNSVIPNSSNKCLHYELGDCNPHYSNDFTSIVTEWDLICSRSSLPNLTQSGFFLGVLLGGWCFGTLTDMFGRKRIFFSCIVGAVITGIGYGIAPGFYIFTFCRVAVAFCNSGIILSGYSLVLEIVGITKRTVAGIAIMGFFGVGYVVLATMAYFIRDWRALCVVGASLGLLFLLSWKMIPESPRWLLIQGEQEHARSVLARIAKGNGTQLPECHLKVPVTGDVTVSMRDLFRGKNIRHRTLVLIFLWFTNSVTYYVLSMTAGNLGGDLYLSFAMSGLVEIPSVIVAYMLVDRVGRRWCHSTFIFVGGFSCLSWMIINCLGGSNSLKVVMALIGKFAVSGSFTIAYLYSAELFPTQVRSVGLGANSIGARVGGILVPIILLLSQYSDGLPMLLIGVTAVVAGTIGLSLPETLNQPMPEILADLD